MDGAHAFAERQIAESVAHRAARWSRDFSSPAAYARSVEPNRARFRSILGLADPRLPAALERYGDDTQPALVAETARYRVWQVRWPVLDGVWGSGLHVEPTTRPVAQAVLIPDADQTPEHSLGLAPGLAPAAQAARRLAENGFELLLPVTLSRAKLTTDDAPLRKSDQTHREWIYRQAFHLGRHVIGYELQIALAAADWLRTRHGGTLPLGIAGYAEGGQTAFYAAAVDARFSAALVSGYFDSRQQVWSEPIYRNVWSLLREFGDAEIAGLILPRTLVVEHSIVPPSPATKATGARPSSRASRPRSPASPPAEHFQRLGWSAAIISPSTTRLSRRSPARSISPTSLPRHPKSPATAAPPSLPPPARPVCCANSKPTCRPSCKNPTRSATPRFSIA
jgi:hypothetical protein